VFKTNERKKFIMDFNSPKFKANIKRVLLITAGWVIAALCIRMIQYSAAINELGENIRPEYNIKNIFLFTIIEVSIVGLIIASFEVFYLSGRFIKKAFGYSVLMKAIFYTISIGIAINLIFYLESKYYVDLHNFSSGNISIVFIVNFFIWGIVFLITEFILQVSDKFGQGVLMNFILGKYHSPKEEIRIFMFLDMKSSTTIAELLGNIKYFELLNDVFYDFTDAIIETKGEIYEYVGDEIVISWKLENGIENANCLKCFFHIKEILKAHSEQYRKKFGVVPTFKAGMHCGEVTVGEVGILKREITFSGDVLNTSSRIQEQCNRYNEKLIVSKQLLDLISVKDKFILREIGDMTLRGKSEPVYLISLQV
jgi:adenylate cyclase